MLFRSDQEAALQVLLPLSRGKGSRLVNPLRELPASLTYELSAGVHLSGAIGALGKLWDVRASSRLAEIATELPNFASCSFRALGSPLHARFAPQLATLAERWPRELRDMTCDALWHMETEEAFEAYIKIRLKDGWPFSEETMRKSWAMRMDEIRNPKPWKREPVKRLPLPP